ncbi:DUF1822 family protein [Leptolyngbya sp. FACHB-16]|uniref:DUF1822 family protein n=1 Tax=unclassified Leptolyngbya TaxID=2650499 RepID=UPI00168929F1|nr:DUF1822 family protein [Leptolyngbya sp. FACHB-16]MBD2158406.1 DUF1822 family protein [Leptolyngbya sp. FACHB-16]
MMTNTFDDIAPVGKFLRSDAISLTSEQIDHAIAASQQGQTHDEQWRLYLQALAIEGIQEWFQMRAPDLPIIRAARDVSWKASTGGIWEQLQVGQFRVNLLITDALESREVALPEAALTHPNGIAHFYVLVEVMDEEEQVTIGPYLRQDQLMQQSELLVMDGLYWLDTSWFEEPSDRLLLDLQFLNPSAIPLETVTPASSTPALLLPTVRQVMNTGLWLRGQLDQVAQDLAWILLPPVAMPSPLRPTRAPDEQLNILVSNLVEQQGVLIPAQARSACKVLREGDREFYLYAISWEVIAPGQTPEWSLMTILAAPSGVPLPANTSLQLWEGQGLLVEQRLEYPTDGGYLYAQVGGLQNEQFTIRVQFPNQEAIQFPPFSFEKGEA